MMQQAKQMLGLVKPKKIDLKDTNVIFFLILPADKIPAFDVIAKH
jgi:hypothetical protein